MRRKWVESATAAIWGHAVGEVTSTDGAHSGIANAIDEDEALALRQATHSGLDLRVPLGFRVGRLAIDALLGVAGVLTQRGERRA